MRKLRKFMVKKPFEDKMPTNSMFEILEENIPVLRNNQFLVEAKYISVDPYMRSFAQGQKLPYMQFGFQVGQVVESKNKEFPVGSNVVSHAGWCDFAVLDGSSDEMFKMLPYSPPIGSHPLSFAVGALGMPGMTAYLGLMEICNPQKGDIICVTSACGAVGSLVGQFAKIKACTVIGFTGSDVKVKVLKEMGFHHAFNYKSDMNVKSTLKQIAPSGINIYFDNVGGALAETIMECMAKKGRVAVCGAISTYGNERSRSKRSLASVSMSIHVESFSFTQWEWSKQREALEQIRNWIDKGQVIVKETVTSGFEKLPDAFMGMLKGDNIGKAVVKI